MEYGGVQFFRVRQTDVSAECSDVKTEKLKIVLIFTVDMACMA